ncbi:hypothetical protein ABOZ73_02495 [Caulobacter sp. 73W]|uniref:Uncharacterized protein n=1 Tax=Caulobacter sp. 73W TaxID=3161137 RepID=A0AB39KTM8_9CAUL
MTDAPHDPDLQAMADDELSRACTLSWRELSRVTPWGDTFEGVAPGGRYVEVERNYIWAQESGGDILVEIVVSGGASRYAQGARASRIIKKGNA